MTVSIIALRMTCQQVIAETKTPHSTSDGYKTVGKQWGLAIERYLQLDPQRAPGQAQRTPVQEKKPGQRIR